MQHACWSRECLRGSRLRAAVESVTCPVTGAPAGGVPEDVGPDRSGFVLSVAAQKRECLSCSRAIAVTAADLLSTHGPRSDGCARSGLVHNDVSPTATLTMSATVPRAAAIDVGLAKRSLATTSHSTSHDVAAAPAVLATTVVRHLQMLSALNKACVLM